MGVKFQIHARFRAAIPAVLELEVEPEDQAGLMAFEIDEIERSR
jgi:hypothetical protein